MGNALVVGVVHEIGKIIDKAEKERIQKMGIKESVTHGREAGKPLTIGSLFSGYGGLDTAITMVTGAEPAWFVEFDDAPSRILAYHYPNIPNLGDITKIDWESVPPVDIIAGGSPCQDVSTAGRRAGMTEGTRSNLWVNMREAIRTIHPKIVVWENVLGSLSAHAASESDIIDDDTLAMVSSGIHPAGDKPGGHLRALGRVLGDLAELGYNAEWTVIKASDIGSCHHRARVFVVAYPETMSKKTLKNITL